MAIGLTEDWEGLHLLRIVSAAVSRLLAEFGRTGYGWCTTWKAKPKHARIDYNLGSWTFFYCDEGNMLL